MTRCLLVLVGLVASRVAFASCGLDYCPMPASGAHAHPVTFRDMVQVTGVEGGGYVEQHAAATMTAPWGFTVGGGIPLVALATEGKVRAGLGNAVVHADWGVPTREPELFALHLGVQLELPTSSDEVLGGHHVVLLPYAATRAALGMMDVTGRAGFGRMIGPHDHHEDDIGVTVNPHSDAELLGRLEVKRRFVVGPGPTLFALGVLGDGVQELGHHERATIVAAGVTAGVESGRFGLDVRGLAPLTDSRRYDWQANATVRVGLGRHPSTSSVTR